MKKNLLFVFIISVMSIKAQQWCMPGATWVYTINATGWTKVNGYSQLKFVDTLRVNGKLCQIINWHRVQYYTYHPNTPPLVNGGQVITNLEQGCLTYSTGLNRFDTIADFKGGPGAHWYIVPQGPLAPGTSLPRITVRDTGHAIVNGVNLKYLQVGRGDSAKICGPNPGFLWYIYERIGSTSGFMYYYLVPYLVDFYDDAGSFLCYYDSGFAGYSKIADGCRINYLSNPELTAIKTSVIFPNPVHGILHLNGSLSKFALYSTTGNMLKLLTTNEIDMTDVVPGLYFIQESINTQVIWHKLVVE